VNEETRELRRLLDEYLLPDLETMAGIRTDRGGLGYPMLFTILAGIEVVGVLLSGSEDASAHAAFWKELSKDHEKYEAAGEVFRRAIRNSTAHSFLVHTRIRVSKTGTGNLTVTDGNINVDLLELLDDFHHTYKRLMSEIDSGTLDVTKGSKRIVKRLTQKDSAITALAANLPAHPGPAGATGPPSFPGTIPFGASATEFRTIKGDDE
jgi:hypothetical protein